MSELNTETRDPQNSVAPPSPQTPVSNVGGKKSLGARAARLSWQLPIGAVVVNIVANAFENQSRLFGWICGGLIVLGFIAGVVALTSVVRYGWRHILIPSILGIAINGFLIWMTVMAVLRIRGAQ